MRHVASFFIATVMLGPMVITSGVGCRSRPESDATSTTNGTRAIPSFGVSVPAVAPAGFVETGELWSGLYSGAVASWTIEAAAASPSTHPVSATRATSKPPKVERIDLIWRLLSMHVREGITDDFVECAINPTGSTFVRPESFGASAVKRRVPHETSLPTLRYERPDGTPTPGGDPERPFSGTIQTEAVKNGQLVLVLIHSAPTETGGTEAGKAAFDAIAAGLRFERPVDFGQSLKREGLRRTLPGHDGFTVLMPEPFSAVGGSAQAYDLTELWLSEKEQEGHSREGYLASMQFDVGARDPKPRWLENVNARPPGRSAIAWRRDEPDLRVVEPVGRRDRQQARVGYVAGRRVEGDRWVWVSLELRPRAIDLLGGDDGVVDMLVRTLNSVEASGGR